MTKFLRGATTTLALGGLLAACAPSQSRPPASHSKAAASQDQTPDLAATGQGGTGDLPDPKHPGWMLWHLSFRSVTAILKAQTVQMHGVVAILFHNGQRDARVTAPTATANTGSEAITATDGVNYVSLTQPGTYLRADTVRWNARTQRGVAQGNVYLHKGKNGGDLYLPHLYFNSGLQKASSDPF